MRHALALLIKLAKGQKWDAEVCMARVKRDVKFLGD